MSWFLMDGQTGHELCFHGQPGFHNIYVPHSEARPILHPRRRNKQTYKIFQNRAHYIAK